MPKIEKSRNNVIRTFQSASFGNEQKKKQQQQQHEHRLFTCVCVCVFLHAFVSESTRKKNNFELLPPWVYRNLSTFWFPCVYLVPRVYIVLSRSVLFYPSNNNKNYYILLFSRFPYFCSQSELIDHDSCVFVCFILRLSSNGKCFNSGSLFFSCLIDWLVGRIIWIRYFHFIYISTQGAYNVRVHTHLSARKLEYEFLLTLAKHWFSVQLPSNK